MMLCECLWTVHVWTRREGGQKTSLKLVTIARPARHDPGSVTAEIKWSSRVAKRISNRGGQHLIVVFKRVDVDAEIGPCVQTMSNNFIE